MKWFPAKTSDPRLITVNCLSLVTECAANLLTSDWIPHTDLYKTQHTHKFANDYTLSSILLNSAMTLFSNSNAFGLHRLNSLIHFCSHSHTGKKTCDGNEASQSGYKSALKELKSHESNTSL